MKMRIVGVLVAAVALTGQLSIATASASPVTEGSVWRVNGSVLSGAESIECSLEGSENIEIESEVLGLPIQLNATGIECVEFAISNKEGMAVGSGKLRFTGLEVVSPSNCTIGSSFETELLTLTTKMDSANSNRVLHEIKPATGSEFGAFPIEECAVQGEYPFAGTLFMEEESGTGVFASLKKWLLDTVDSGLTLAGNTVNVVIGDINISLFNGWSFGCSRN